MNQIKILVIESAVESLKKILTECLSPITNEVLPIFVKSYGEAVSALYNYWPQIAVIDNEAVSKEELQELYSIGFPTVSFIIISNNPSDAVECYLTGVPIDFVLKPLTSERVVVSINRALKRGISCRQNNHLPNSIFLKVGRGFQKIVIDEIIYIEACGIYVKLITINGKHLINESITGITRMLQSYNFIRIHKSYVVNINKIDHIRASSIEVCHQSLPIGLTYKEVVNSIVES